MFMHTWLDNIGSLAQSCFVFGLQLSTCYTAGNYPGRFCCHSLLQALGFRGDWVQHRKNGGYWLRAGGGIEPMQQTRIGYQVMLLKMLTCL